MKAKLFIILLLAAQFTIAANLYANPAGSNDLYTQISDSATIRSKSSSAFQIEKPGIISLTKGEVLISANKQTLVKSGNHLVDISAGSIVLIIVSDDAMIVRTLWSSSADAVSTYIGKRVISVHAGDEIIVGNDISQVTKILKSDNIARRRVRIFDLSNSIAVSQAEVSLVSVMNNSKVLSGMLASKDTDDHALINKLQKMAACLAQTTARHGPYSVVGMP